MFRESKKRISFTRNFGNPNGLKLSEMLAIFDKEYYKINKKHFIAEFSSKFPNKNLIDIKAKNSFFSKKSSKSVISNYLKTMINDQKIKLI